MGDLFSGEAQQLTNTTEKIEGSPQWLRDATFNLVNTGQNVATLPYQDYTDEAAASQLPLAANRVAAPSAQTQQAWQGVQNAQGAWTPVLNQAISGMGAMAGGPSAPYNPGGGMAYPSGPMPPANMPPVDGIPPIQKSPQDYGFTGPPPGGMATQAMVPWTNTKTGETTWTNSGGYQAPSADWVANYDGPPVSGQQQPQQPKSYQDYMGQMEQQSPVWTQIQALQASMRPYVASGNEPPADMMSQLNALGQQHNQYMQQYVPQQPQPQQPPTYMDAQYQGLNSINYNAPTQALNPWLTQAQQTNGANAAQPWMNTAAQMGNTAGNTSTSGVVQQAQQQYTDPRIAGQYLQGSGQAFGGAAAVDPLTGAANYMNAAAGQSAAGAASGNLNQAAVMSPIGAANPYLNASFQTNAATAAANTLGQASGINAMGNANPYLNQSAQTSAAQAANQLINQSAGKSAYNAGAGYLGQAAGISPTQAAASALAQAQGMSPSQAGGAEFNRAASLDAVGAASPYINNAVNVNSLAAAQGDFNTARGLGQQAVTERALAAADPYMQNAAQSSVSNIDSYMNPYNRNVTDEIARMGGRNLREELLPSVSDAFIKAGGFGGSRMGEFGSRAVRDTQSSILAEQAKALQSGYGQSMQTAQGDLARQAQLAGTAGNIALGDLGRTVDVAQLGAQMGQTSGQLTAADADRMLQGGQAMGQLTSSQMQNLANIGQSRGQLTAQEQSNLANIGQTQGQLASAQQQNLANIGQTAGQLTGMDASTLANLAQTRGQLTGMDASNLANLGQTAGQISNQQQSNLANIGQTQGQLTGMDASRYAQLGQTAGQLTSAQQQALAQIGQTQGQLTGMDASLLAQLGNQYGNLGNQYQQNLTQLGSAQASAGAAQQGLGLNAAQNVQGAQTQDLARMLQAAGLNSNIGQILGGLTVDQQKALLQSGQLSANTALGQQGNQLTGTGQLGTLAGLQQNASNNLAAMAGQGQNMTYKDIGALSGVGEQNTAYDQQLLDTAYSQFKEQNQYPQSQLDWLSGIIRGAQPTAGTYGSATTTGSGNTYSPSPLSQVLSGLSVYKGINP